MQDLVKVLQRLVKFMQYLVKFLPEWLLKRRFKSHHHSNSLALGAPKAKELLQSRIAGFHRLTTWLALLDRLLSVVRISFTSLPGNNHVQGLY
jgi:hypothetical protein